MSPSCGAFAASSSAGNCRISCSSLLAPGARVPVPFRPSHGAAKAKSSHSSTLVQASSSASRLPPNRLPLTQRFPSRPQRLSHASPTLAAAVDVVSPSPSAAPSQTPTLPRSNPNAPTFQQAITKLQEYWASVGCAIWLPHNTEVGAGTMNPATFLRVLGPEPWNVCYAEPSIRPDDSRYGDNPNRLQRHTQFQVILKPDPGNSQELYLGSLEALGIDTKSHDVRFVEDNWESPVLGAWGLGWEVWLDGMEVTQFTYFQQAGGKTLDAPAVEITYGMERILMALQGVTNFRDIRYNEQVSYGELFLQNEYEMSCYNLDEADIAEQRTRFELYEKEARRMLAKRLPIPAYDHVLKLSHTFNLLDARGAVGVTERAACFAVMRGLAREVTSLWMARREELGHPLGLVAPAPAPAPAVAPSSAAPSAASAPRAFVLEVGTEELPPEDVVAAVEQLRTKVGVLMERLRLPHSNVSVEGTPRRLSVLVHDLGLHQEAEEQRVRGPPASAAYGKDGAATKALEGFCRKNNVSPEACVREADAKGVEYVWAEVRSEGRPSCDVLGEELPSLLSGLSFKKSMRWSMAGAAFSRPVRWLLALHGDSIVPFQCMGLASGDVTRGLRNSNDPIIKVTSAESYRSQLSAAGISLIISERKEAIWTAVVAAAAAAGGTVPESTKEDLLEEVTQLVEAPSVVSGTFSSSFLALPQEVLVMVMRKHQRYFPVFASGEAGGQLLPVFLTVANGPVDPEVVAAGNGAVLRARFEDADFFYKEDLKQRLEAFRPRLSGTLFHKDLGSLLEKSDRVEELVTLLAPATGLDSGDTPAIARAAAHLAKADLATSTVTEMTALAGTMGRHFAYKQGESPAVAEAVFESCLPRQSGDLLPSSPAGILVSLADRLDSLVGLFAAGCAPTASTDQYGLRRAAYGMLQTLVSARVRLSLSAAVSLTAGLQPLTVSSEVQKEVLKYLQGRMEQLLVEAGTAPEAVRAVLAERGDDPALAAATAEELRGEWCEGEGSSRLKAVMQALGRPSRIVRSKSIDPSIPVAPELFDCDEERRLYEALVAVEGAVGPAAGRVKLSLLLEACMHMVEPIDAFFGKVFVMCDDEAVRNNRLALLNRMANITRGVIDLSHLPGF